MDGGVAAPAFTFRFSIPVFTLGVFPTNESLCTEVVTCGGRDKGSLKHLLVENRRRAHRPEIKAKQTEIKAKQTQAMTRKLLPTKLWRCSTELMAGEREFSAVAVGSFSITVRKAAGSKQPPRRFKVTSAQIGWLPPREPTLTEQRGDIPDTQLDFSLHTADSALTQLKRKGHSVISNSMDLLCLGSKPSRKC